MRRLAGAYGLVEHSTGTKLRPELGYATDDAGRALALACRLSDDSDARRLASSMLGALELAATNNGRFHVRLDHAGHPTGDEPSDDAVGRALLGLGTAAALAPWPSIRRRSAMLFERSSPDLCHLRSIAYAALGAIEVVEAGLDSPRPSRSPYDGLTATGVNLNQGAESSLALVEAGIWAGSRPYQPRSSRR